MSTPNTPAGTFPRRIMVGGAVAAIAMSFALTALVMANNLHQFENGQNPNGISWDQATQGTADECKDADLEPGEVLWHFIQNQVDDAILSGKMTATFADAGTFTDVVSYKKSGGTLHWSITTPGHDTLLSASTNVISNGEFNLSHVCAGPEGSVEESVAESASAEQSVEGSVSESVAESAEQSVEGSTSESVAESEEASGEQSVEAGTGTPEESTPDGALFGHGASPLPTIAFSMILLASLGGLAYANVKSVRR